ncbi:PHP domain-containing protein [Herbivorax sp. ANBcel31]|uniref:PHP domain-containing protein n=1 Tax=Herbivorax sp. ANBcel31 TaxID=3069754 RepID=UPI0027B52CAB|nr:PHP domain-containing protein [Herbivorax sp. ANBcel31]MDQ2086662.1 PHP domain-containing protein [Herbivorax sp. ANBcel31]
MDKLIDLHTHSVVSDGTMTPSELVRHGKEVGLSAMALTDHDTIDGIEEALREAEKVEIEVVAGVEISVEFNHLSEMHLLGYFFKGSHNNLKPLLEKLKVSREERNPKMVKKLNQLGFDISLDEVKMEAKGKVVARPHIASVLLKKGYIKSIKEAFDKYISTGRPAYVKKERLLPKEAIKEIARCGGIPILAHPIYLNLKLDKLDELLYELKKFGLKGIEAYYPDNTQYDTENFLKLAVKHNLIPTGGSDFHGDFKPDIKLGTGKGNLNVPFESLERIKELI